MCVNGTSIGWRRKENKKVWSLLMKNQLNVYIVVGNRISLQRDVLGMKKIVKVMLKAVGG